MSVNTEVLNFRVGISGTYWGNKPQYVVMIHGHDMEPIAGTIKLKSDNVEIVDFDVELADGEYELHVYLTNKTDADVVQAAGAIVQDMLLNIDSIEVDDIDIGTLRHTESTFIMKQPQMYNGETITELKHCVNLGWNGAYTLPFSVPFHYWLLEKL